VGATILSRIIVRSRYAGLNSNTSEVVMDMIFTCPNCKQQLEAETSMAGTEITCPSCNGSIVIPEPNVMNVRANPIASSAGAKEEYHFSVPVHDAPSEVLIQKAKPPLEVAKDGKKHLRMKCIRRTDCVEVGKDRFDEIVSDFLDGIGETNIVSITPLAYTHMDLGSRQLMTDFGVMIVYKG
jgi:DNA-directed RNA polymerase subunit RPC12/RpoP